MKVNKVNKENSSKEGSKFTLKHSDKFDMTSDDKENVPFLKHANNQTNVTLNVNANPFEYKKKFTKKSINKPFMNRVSKF